MSRFEVQRHALDAAGELDHLAGLDIVEAVDAGDAVADGQHLADFADLGFVAEVVDLALQDGGDFGGRMSIGQFPLMAARKPSSLVRSDESIMREPTFTTRPPSRVGSTLVSSRGSLPSLALSTRLQFGESRRR